MDTMEWKHLQSCADRPAGCGGQKKRKQKKQKSCTRGGGEDGMEASSKLGVLTIVDTALYAELI